MMRILVILTVATALGAAELRPAVELAAELVESRIVEDHPDARWLRAVAAGLRSGRISVHEATALVAMIGQAGGASGARVAPLAPVAPLATPGSEPQSEPDLEAEAEPAVEADQALAALVAEVEQLDAVAETESPPMPAPVAVEPVAVQLVANPAVSPVQAVQALAVLDEPEPAPAPSTTAPGQLPLDSAASSSPAAEAGLEMEAGAAAANAGDPVEPDVTPGEAALSTAPAEPERSPAAFDPAGQVAVRVVHVKQAETPDDPDLVMIEGTRMRKGQTLSLRRDQQEAVRLLVLRVEGTMAMAMVLGATWAEAAERPVAIGDQAYALTGD